MRLCGAAWCALGRRAQRVCRHCSCILIITQLVSQLEQWVAAWGVWGTTACWKLQVGVLYATQRSTVVIWGLFRALLGELRNSRGAMHSHCWFFVCLSICCVSCRILPDHLRALQLLPHPAAGSRVSRSHRVCLGHESVNQQCGVSCTAWPDCDCDGA